MITSTSIGDTGYSSPENYPSNSTSADTSDFTSNVGGSDSSDNVYAHNSYEYATKKFDEILSQFDPVKDKATYDMFSRMRDSLLSFLPRLLLLQIVQSTIIHKYLLEIFSY